jgi:hypothetical protein
MKNSEQVILDIKTRYEALSWTMDERMRRLWAASEAKSLGHGGVMAVFKATGISRQTIYVGLQEIEDKELPSPEEPRPRIRRAGAGPPTTIEKYPNILKVLESLVDPVTRGDPMSPLRWTTKSLRTLSEELKAQGYDVSHVTVGELLETLGYSLQANAKIREGISADNPDRDAQFNYINEQSERAMEANIPVLSVDTKKKELIGQFKNPGRTWEPKKKPVTVNDHDFLDEELGKVAPYGILDLANNEGMVNVGTDHDTASFAVEGIRRWHYIRGQFLYPDCSEIFITADGGGSNGYRSRLWKLELQKLADEIGKSIRVSHFPPGTSKWNKIEHQMFSYISMNWKGIPLTSHEVVINLIANTRTRKGLKIHAVLDTNKYPTGTKVSDKELAEINIERASFRGEWNYKISPRTK